jgi:hypothetical protein
MPFSTAKRETANAPRRPLVDLSQFRLAECAASLTLAETLILSVTTLFV